jgi:protocatechuate 3,4-dioxygenase beta subunit
MAGCFLAFSSLTFGFQAKPVTPPRATQPAQQIPQQPAPTGTSAIEGQILNQATGAPLKKAGVRLFGSRTQPGIMPVNSSRETDDQGRFSFTSLPPGKYQLSANRQGFLNASYGARKFSGNGTPINLGQDQQVKDLIVRLSPQSVIVGKVLDEDGEPVANVQVRVFKYQYRGGKRQWTNANNANTSDIGEYRIPNLMPGRYIVSASPRNQAMNGMQTAAEPLPDKPEMAYAATYYPASVQQSAAVPVDVGPGAEVRGIDIRPVKTRVFRIRGKVVMPEGAAEGVRGQPTVMLSARDGNEFQAPGRMSMSRPPDYRFEISDVRPGSYNITANINGNGGQQLVAMQPVEVGANHVDGLILTLSAGADVQGLVKVEDATPPPASPPTSPIDLGNVTVNLRPTGMNFGRVPRGKVGPDSRFTLNGVAAVPYAITPGGLPDNCYVKSIRYGGREVPEAGIDMSSGGTLEIILSATAAAVDGVVMDKNNKPVAGALVALIPKDGTQATGRSADENGIISFKGLKPGEYNLIAWEDLEQGAYTDPDFVKPFESRAKTVKLDPGAHEAVQLKVIPVEEMEKP